jgi:hypothetical protein
LEITALLVTIFVAAVGWWVWRRPIRKRDARAGRRSETTMQLDQVFVLVERLRKEAIGEPKWIEDKRVYEYQEQSARVVAILKITRAAQGLPALVLLCSSGFFIDFGAIMRCVNDCAEEVYFLMEDLNNPSTHVDQFVKEFFESTIDDHLLKKTPSVQRDKIRSAVVRVLKDKQDENTRNLMDNIYKTFMVTSMRTTLILEDAGVEVVESEPGVTLKAPP